MEPDPDPLNVVAVAVPKLRRWQPLGSALEAHSTDARRPVIDLRKDRNPPRSEVSRTVERTEVVVAVVAEG